MKIKKLKIPIYSGNVHIIKAKSLQEVSEKYNLEDLTGFDAVAFRLDDKKGITTYYLAFENPKPYIIAHECLHFVNYLFQDLRIVPDVYNDEPQCYLLGWIFEKCYKFLNP